MTAPTQQIHAHAVSWDRPCLGVPGVNERVIELPLAMDVAQLGTPGWVLDAGCALNSITNLVPAGKQPIAHLVHVTQAISSERITPSGTQRSYVSADLRDLSIFADRAFDRTICVSTLEHVGFDNSAYAAPVEHQPDSWRLALAELWRVTRGTLFVTVPFAPMPTQNDRWRYFSPREIAGAGWPGVVAHQFYGKQDGTWAGGGTVPMTVDPAGFPDKVNQIVCVKMLRV